MEILDLDAGLETIGARAYDVRLASSLKLAEGHGEAHAYVLRFDPAGEVGLHEAGFGQLLVPLQGSGWVASADGERLPLRGGQAALIRRGEVHAKGSVEGMTALMIQVRELTPPSAGTPEDPRSDPRTRE